MAWVDSLIKFFEKALDIAVAVVSFYAGKGAERTEIEKQEAEKDLENKLNAAKAQEKIREKSDAVKQKIENSWDRIGVQLPRSRVRSKNSKG